MSDSTLLELVKKLIPPGRDPRVFWQEEIARWEKATEYHEYDPNECETEPKGLAYYLGYREDTPEEAALRQKIADASDDDVVPMSKAELKLLRKLRL